MNQPSLQKIKIVSALVLVIITGALLYLYGYRSGPPGTQEQKFLFLIDGPASRFFALGKKLEVKTKIDSTSYEVSETQVDKVTFFANDSAPFGYFRLSVSDKPYTEYLDNQRIGRLLKLASPLPRMDEEVSLTVAGQAQTFKLQAYGAGFFLLRCYKRADATIAPDLATAPTAPPAAYCELIRLWQ